MEHATNPAACREICECVVAARAIGCLPTGLADGLARDPPRYQVTRPAIRPGTFLWVPRSPPAGGDSASGNLPPVQAHLKPRETGGGVCHHQWSHAKTHIIRS